MKKYSLIYMLSFVFYSLALVSLPYITVQTWADILFFLFIGSCIYQLIYIIYLRKKENVTLGRSIARYFLYLSIVGSIFIVITYLDLFINGYEQRTFVTGDLIETYYKFEAWKNAGFVNFFCLPLLAMFTIYEILYALKGRKKSNN